MQFSSWLSETQTRSSDKTHKRDEPKGPWRWQDEGNIYSDIEYKFKEYASLCQSNLIRQAESIFLEVIWR